MLKEGANVYKLVGPVLISVDLQEAKENVNKRLQFIEGEVSKIEASIGRPRNLNKLPLVNNLKYYYIASKQKEASSLGDEIASIQQKMQGATSQISYRLSQFFNLLRCL